MGRLVGTGDGPELQWEKPHAGVVCMENAGFIRVSKGPTVLWLVFRV